MSTSGDSPPSQRWYVLEAMGESKVSEAYLRLAVAGLKVWMPTVQRRDPRRGRGGEPRRDKPIPRFGRFLLVHVTLTDEIYHAIESTPCVRGFLRSSKVDRPSPVPDSQVDWLREWSESNPKKGEPEFIVSDLVKIVEGPFTGLIGPVKSIDNRGCLIVEIELFSQPTPSLIPAQHVEMERPAKSRGLLTKREARPSRLTQLGNSDSHKFGLAPA